MTQAGAIPWRGQDDLNYAAKTLRLMLSQMHDVGRGWHRLERQLAGITAHVMRLGGRDIARYNMDTLIDLARLWYLGYVDTQLTLEALTVSATNPYASPAP